MNRSKGRLCPVRSYIRARGRNKQKETFNNCICPRSGANCLSYTLELSPLQCLATVIIVVVVSIWILVSSQRDLEGHDIPPFYISVMAVCIYCAPAKCWNPSLIIILYISPMIIGSFFIFADDSNPEYMTLFILIVEDILMFLLLLCGPSMYPVILSKQSFHLLKDTWLNWFLLDFASSKMPSSFECQIADCKSKCNIGC